MLYCPVGFEVVRRVILSWSFFISPSWYVEFFFGIIEAMVSLAALFIIFLISNKMHD